MRIVEGIRRLLHRTDAPLPPADPRRWAVFAHYDPDGMVAPYVLVHLRALRRLGFGILFVSTAPDLDEEESGPLRALCADILLRENHGLDFGSWQHGLARLPVGTQLDELLLANDSVFGPLSDLQAARRRMVRAGADFWGITDSLQHDWHLQSYFLCFGAAVLRSEAFAAFWRQPFSGRSRDEIIRKGEIGLSQQLTRAGFRGAALCPVRSVAKMHGRRARMPAERLLHANPTHFFWETLIRDCGCPFIKKELLRDNPERLPGLQRWKHVVRSNLAYDPELIDGYLRRLRGPNWLEAVTVDDS